MIRYQVQRTQLQSWREWRGKRWTDTEWSKWPFPSLHLYQFHVKWDFAQIKEDKILEKLRQAEEALEDEDLDKALVDFNKVLFYDKTIPEVFVEKAEIYIKLCDFSSAI